MSDSANARSPSNASADSWPRPSLNSQISSNSVRRDSKNSLQHGMKSPMQSPASPRTLASPKPSLQDDGSRRTSLSNIPSYVSTTPALSMRGSARAPSISQRPHMDGMYNYRRQGSMSYQQSLSSSRMTASRVPTAMPENDYLGFCKGAWKLQNGDRKGAMEKCKEAQSWSRNASRSTTLAQHLKCSQSKCAFRSNYISSDSDLIYEKVINFPEKGIKLRWGFLAKSHVPQKVVLRNQYAFKCLFCVFMGLGGRAGVYVGTEYYLDHINMEHRGTAMGEVLQFKTNCIIDRVADNDEEFDINLWPLEASREDGGTQQWLSDSLLGDPAHMPRLPPNEAIGANEPWIVDASFFEDFDTSNIDLNIEDDRQTVTTAIHHPRSPQAGDPPRLSMATEAETVSPSDFPPPPEPKSRKFTYEDWEDNPEEIWGANQKGPTNDPFAHPPHIPSRNNARLASIRERPGADPALMSSPFTSLSRIGSHDSQKDMPMPVEEETDLDLGVTMALKTIIQAFNDGAMIVEELKRNPMFASMSLLPMLEESVTEAPDEIDREWQRGVTRYGVSFEAGDYIAIIALQQITIALHNRLVDALRVVALGRATDLAYLIDIADTARHRTIATLHELRQRLMQAPPPSLMSDPATARMAPPHSQAGPQRSASHPNTQQHLSHMRPDIWKDPYFPDKNSNASRNASTSSKDSKHSRAQSDVTGITASRKPSVLNTFSKPKWTRKISLSRSPQGSKEDVNVGRLADSVQGGLKLHQRKKSDLAKDDGLEDVVELDSTPVLNAVG